MATFKFGRTVDIHWNGYDIQGPADTVFSIPDQLYEEFDADIAPVEPTLVWLDTNEFLTLQNNVSVSTLSATFPIALATSTSGKTISLSSSTNPNGYLLAADGSGGIIFTPASTSGLTSVVGASPISSTIAGGTATVSIDQAAITGATAATNAQVVRFYVKNTTGTTIPKGSAVYVSGATGDNALISLASATSDPSSSKTLGITAEAIANDAFGYVIEAGYLTDIDTSATTAGAAVWLGNTPGSLVFVSPPAEPSHAVYLGVVVRVQSINGSILVKVQNGYELDELHDVFVGGVSTALPLVYSSTSSGWIAQALSSVGIADNAVVESKINAGAVTSSKIGAAAINSTHIGANAVVAGDIAANAVTSGNIAAGAVNSAALADNAVVAAKIAANSVGITKIDSGSATSGQILTANGSSGVSFTTLESGGISVVTATTSAENTIPAFYADQSYSSALAQKSKSIAYDPVNNHVYIAGATTTGNVGSSSMVFKVDVATGSQLASVSIAMSTSTTNREGIVAAAWGSDKLCLLTNSSVATAAPTSRWFILNSSLSTLATGNIHSTTQGADNRAVSSASFQRLNVRYDKNANQFVIQAVTNSASGTASAFPLFRILDPGTYTTGYYINQSPISIGASTLTATVRYGTDVETNPSNMVYVPSLSRWVYWHSYNVTGAPNNPNIQVVSFSQTTTTTAIFAIVGRQIGASTSSTYETQISNATKYLTLNNAGTSLIGASDGGFMKILVSNISANINTNSSSGFSFRFSTASSDAYIPEGETSGWLSSWVKYLSNGSDEWLFYVNRSTSSNFGGSIIATSVLVDSGANGLDFDSTKNYYQRVSQVSTTDNMNLSDSFDAQSYTGSSSIDVGVNGSSVFCLFQATDSGTPKLRFIKMGNLSKAIMSIHQTSDPLTEISISPYTNSDTSTPILSGYIASGTSLKNATFSGTYWNPLSDGSGLSNNSTQIGASYVMEPGSSAYQLIGSSTTTVPTNTTTVKILRKR